MIYFIIFMGYLKKGRSDFFSFRNNIVLVFVIFVESMFFNKININMKNM